MTSVLETDVKAETEKTEGFVKNGIFSVFDRTKQALSPPIYCTAKDCSSVQL